MLQLERHSTTFIPQSHNELSLGGSKASDTCSVSMQHQRDCLQLSKYPSKEATLDNIIFEWLFLDFTINVHSSENRVFWSLKTISYVSRTSLYIISHYSRMEGLVTTHLLHPITIPLLFLYFHAILQGCRGPPYHHHLKNARSLWLFRVMTLGGARAEFFRWLNSISDLSSTLLTSCQFLIPTNKRFKIYKNMNDYKRVLLPFAIYKVW